MRYIKLFGCTVLLAGLCTCGDSGGKSGGGGAPQGATYQTFSTVANELKIPLRFLLAASYLESGISSTESTSVYLAGNIGAVTGQTAFGLSYDQLGITADDSRTNLSTQVSAYGTYVKSKVADLTLSPIPKTNRDKLDWIWELSKIHRSGSNDTRNVQVMFAKELIKILNEGFFWQGGDEGFRLEPENPPISETGDYADKLLYLAGRPVDVDSANFLQLTIASEGGENVPKKIKVVHCPFHISACLEAQNPPDNFVRLGAHYLIPPNWEHVKTPLQITRHNRRVKMTSRDGNIREVEDAIVVMLTGNSGRIIDGKRHPANPTWLTNTQLQAMGQLINEICRVLERSDGINYSECVSVEHPNGIEFQQAGSSESFTFGDIADFDETLFHAYIASLGGLSGATHLSFNQAGKRYRAGQPVVYKIEVPQSARLLEVEVMQRCPDERKVVWTRIKSRQIMPNELELTFNNDIFLDGGPNGNGEQFLRLRTFTGPRADVLAGWQVENFFVTDFDPELTPYSKQACLE